VQGAWEWPVGGVRGRKREVPPGSRGWAARLGVIEYLASFYWPFILTFVVFAISVWVVKFLRKMAKKTQSGVDS
jgi:hypothetical protein